MSTCSIAGCDNTLKPNTRLKTCQTCRNSLHKLERQRPAYIVERNTKLTKYQNRLNTIALIEDGEARIISRDRLVDDGIMLFKKSKSRSRRKKA